MPQKVPRLSRLEERLSSARSKFGAWLDKPGNLEAFRNVLRRSRADWEAIAEWANQEGLTGRQGAQLTPQGARQTYARAIRRAKERTQLAALVPQPQPAAPT